MFLINLLQSFFSRNVEFGGVVSDSRVHLTQDSFGYDREFLEPIEPETIKASSTAELLKKMETINPTKSTFSNPYICRELSDGRALLNGIWEPRPAAKIQCLRIKDTFNRQASEKTLKEFDEVFLRNIGFWGSKSYCIRTPTSTSKEVREECSINFLKTVF